MPNPKHPVSSFGPELLEALRKGTEKRYELKFDDPRLAIRFRHRLHHFRTAMRREKRPETDELFRCGIHISHEDPCVLIIAPKDSEFRDVLRQAGVGVGEPLAPRVVEVTTPTTEEDAADSFLGELTEATRVPSSTEGRPPKNTNEDK